MVYEFDCPDCDYAKQGNEMETVVESAQQHVRDQHGDMPEREEVEQYVIGPG